MFSLNSNSSGCATSRSPCTPDTSTMSYSINAEQYTFQKTLISKGYTPIKRIATALQGSVWETFKNGTIYIIKIAQKSLYSKGITYMNAEEVEIKEDIVKESEIMRHLTHNDPPESITKFVDFFDDKYNYFLVMENGGNNLFDFVRKCHEYIGIKFLEISEWISFCKTAMKQIIKLMDWMHNTMNCCHLDISLENFVIDGLCIEVIETDNDQKLLKLNSDFQIKLIDFGLAEVFTKTNNGEIVFESDKYVGKTPYKSPEVYGKKNVFDARSADCWSFGVCLFMMIIGTAPFGRASSKDERFCLIMNGEMFPLLYSWDRINYVNSDLLDLMDRIFQMEKCRISIKDISNHPFLK